MASLTAFNADYDCITGGFPYIDNRRGLGTASARADVGAFAKSSFLGGLMASPALSALLAGLLAGLFGYLHGLLSSNGPYVLFWPLIGGVLAVYIATRHPAALTGAARQVSLAAASGAVATVVFLVILIPTYSELIAVAAAPRGRFPGARAPVQFNSPAVTNFVIVAMAFIPVAAFGGGVAWLFRRFGGSGGR
ncbi:MAG: hypothetical protein NVSMB53_14210 [Gemmatimonadaceae bacterium]